MTALERIETLLPQLTPEEWGRLAQIVTSLSLHIERTPGVNGGAASLGQTRIAVWMLESARREGLSDDDILTMYPQLSAADLMDAWRYVVNHKEEIEGEIQENEEA